MIISIAYIDVNLKFLFKEVILYPHPCATWSEPPSHICTGGKIVPARSLLCSKFRQCFLMAVLSSARERCITKLHCLKFQKVQLRRTGFELDGLKRKIIGKCLANSIKFLRKPCHCTPLQTCKQKKLSVDI